MLPLALDCALCRATTRIYSLDDVDYGCPHIEAGQVEAAIREYWEYMMEEEAEHG